MSKSKKPHLVNVEFRRLLEALRKSTKTWSEVETSVLEVVQDWRGRALAVEEQQAVKRAVYELERLIVMSKGEA